MTYKEMFEALSKKATEARKQGLPISVELEPIYVLSNGDLDHPYDEDEFNDLFYGFSISLIKDNDVRRILVDAVTFDIATAYLDGLVQGTKFVCEKGIEEETPVGILIANIDRENGGAYISLKPNGWKEGVLDIAEVDVADKNECGESTAKIHVWDDPSSEYWQHDYFITQSDLDDANFNNQIVFKNHVSEDLRKELVSGKVAATETIRSVAVMELPGKIDVELNICIFDNGKPDLGFFVCRYINGEWIQEGYLEDVLNTSQWNALTLCIDWASDNWEIQLYTVIRAALRQAAEHFKISLA